MAEQPERRGMRRRSDKLRFIAWANLLLSVLIGLSVDFGDAGLRWAAVALWALLLFAVCHMRAAQMDKEGPVERRQS